MKLPSLNEYVDACRANRYQGSKMKRETEFEIGLYIRRLPKFYKPVKISFLWIESNKRRDPDNVCFAKKFILDALVKFGKLPDDNQQYVRGLTDTFDHGKETKVILTIEEVEE